MATYLLSPVWSVGFWSGHFLELGAFLVVAAALGSDLVRATPSQSLRSEIDVRSVVTQEEALLGAWVERLLARLAAKDSSTREHTRRVAEIAVQVGQELGLRGGRLRGLAVAALLHDVGKLQVPDAILRKAGPLSQSEFDVIKRHPGDGAALLAHIGGFAPSRRRSCAGTTSASTAAATPTACAAPSSRSRCASSASATSTTRSRASASTAAPWGRSRR